MSYDPNVTCLADLIGIAVRRNPNAVAIEFEGGSRTYGQFWDRANRCAHALLALGLNAGDRVALFANNSADYLETYMGLQLAGLVAVPAGTGTAIDLSWEPGTETDLAGYHVYRQELTASNQPLGTSQCPTQTPVTGPAFHDATTIAGHHYAYRVTAIDATGNESPPSAPVLETATEP